MNFQFMLHGTLGNGVFTKNLYLKQNTQKEKLSHEIKHIKEQYPGFSMILRSSQTYLYRKKKATTIYNRLILENSSRK